MSRKVAYRRQQSQDGVLFKPENGGCSFFREHGDILEMSEIFMTTVRTSEILT
jgi:hypothetical protein